jgi:integrase
LVASRGVLSCPGRQLSDADDPRQLIAEAQRLIDRLEPLINAYVAAARIASEPDTPLFRSILSKRQRVSARSVPRDHIRRVIRTIEIGAAEEPVEIRQDRRALSQQSKNTAFPRRSQEADPIDTDAKNCSAADRAVLGVLAYTGASIMDVMMMKCNDFGNTGDGYWIRLPGQLPVEAPPELAVLINAYRAAMLPERNGTAFLFGRDRLNKLTVSDGSLADIGSDPTDSPGGALALLRSRPEPQPETLFQD